MTTSEKAQRLVAINAEYKAYDTIIEELTKAEVMDVERVSIRLRYSWIDCVVPDQIAAQVIATLRTYYVTRKNELLTEAKELMQ